MPENAKKILIVEDEVVSALALERLLADMGHEVIGIATTGEAAVKKARNDHPDIITMDIRLAGKSDGVEAAEIIMAEMNVSIIFMTGYDDTITRSRAMALHPLGFLVKPIDKAKLYGALL